MHAVQRFKKQSSECRLTFIPRLVFKKYISQLATILMVGSLEKLIKIRVFEYSVPEKLLKRLTVTIIKVKLEISA